MDSSGRARTAVILNPKSGRGLGGRQASALIEELNRCEIDFEILRTESPRQAIDLAKRAAADGFHIVAAAGGDGTLNEVVNGVFGTGATFAAIPLGTGNDFCRTLGLGTDWKAAVEAIKNQRVIPIDVGRCRSAQGETYFINIAGCGFDVAVAVRINTGLRKLRGTMAYIAGVLGTYVTYKPERMRITTEGESFDTEVMLCAIANAMSYGGAMRVAPNAKIDDGWFDVVIVEKTTKLEFLTTFPKVFKGTHLSHDKVRSLRSKRIRIETDVPRSALVDGELFDSTPIDFEILPAALPCIVPETFVATDSRVRIANSEEKSPRAT